LAKAQCWLDVSFHEYTRNDRGGVPPASPAARSPGRRARSA